MDRISDEKLDNITKSVSDELENKKELDWIDIFEIEKALIELKECRETDSKPLDIKEQLRLVRDRCPDAWKVILEDKCPDDFGIGDCYSICNAGEYHPCKECFDKMLEGDE